MSVFFTIVTPVYNSDAFLLNTLNSVESQSFTNYEHLIIDDGSTDRSIQIAQDYTTRNPRARLILMLKNGGVAAVRNEGIRQALGKYICFLDSDDTWEKSKLTLQYDLIQRTGSKFLYGSYRHISEKGDYIKTITCPAKSDFRSMLRGSVIGCLTACVDSKIIKQHKFKNIFHEDYLMWLEILRDHQLTAHGVTEPIANYRLRASSLSSNKTEAAKAQWRIYREHLGLGLFEVVPLFLHYALAGIMKHKVNP